MADKRLSKRKEGARRIKAYAQELALKASIKILKMSWAPQIREHHETYKLITNTEERNRWQLSAAKKSKIIREAWELKILRRKYKGCSYNLEPRLAHVN